MDKAKKQEENATGKVVDGSKRKKRFCSSPQIVFVVGKKGGTDKGMVVGKLNVNGSSKKGEKRKGSIQKAKVEYPIKKIVSSGFSSVWGENEKKRREKIFRNRSHSSLAKK